MSLMEDSFPLKQTVGTPAFIYNLSEVKKRVKLLSQIKNKSNCKILYSVKPLPPVQDLRGNGIFGWFFCKFFF